MKALKVVPLTTCVDDEAQPPPMARTPTGSSSSGSPNVISPTPRLPAVQYGSSPGVGWIGTSRVPPKASVMDAVGGSVHAARAVRIWSSVSAPWIGEGLRVLRYQVIAWPLSACCQRSRSPSSVNGSLDAIARRGRHRRGRLRFGQHGASRHAA